jgi:hypothetical protein
MNRKPFEIPNIITIDEAADKINEFLAGSKTEIILRFAYGYYIKLKKHIKKSAPYIEIHTSGYDDTLPAKEAIEWLKWELLDRAANGY